MTLHRYSRHPLCKLFYFTGLFYVLSGCGSENIESIPKTNEFRSYPINIDKSMVGYGDVFESVEFMQLEETDESLLSTVGHAIKVQDKLIFAGYQDGIVYTFSDQGKFISKFGHKGSAEGEYSEIRDIWVKDNSIAIYDGTKETAHWYTMSGDYLRSLKMP